jgi:hypothetical protein
MADTKISALTAATTVASTDELPLNQSGNSRKATVDLLRAYMRKVNAGTPGSANANGVGTETWQVLTSNATANSTTTIATVMSTTTLAAGTYKYRYEIIAQAGATTTGHKFSVDFTGTVTKHSYRLLAPTDGTTAVANSVTNNSATSATIIGHFSTATDNTVVGPTTAVNTANSDIYYTIEGILVCSTSGDLNLGAASEVAASTQVMSGTNMTLYRFA